MRVPGSKSITNRALVCAALAGGDSFIRNPSDSTDSAMMVNGLNQMGVLAIRTENGLKVRAREGSSSRRSIPFRSGMQDHRFLISVARRIGKNRVRRF
jgi:5-enolpyruvylshikimate-3-phosphate synthase